MNRRRFLAGGSALVVASACRDPNVPAPTPDGEPWMGGTFLGLAPFVAPAGRPFGTKYNAGWDARLLLELATLDVDGLVVEDGDFYVRTELPDRLDIAEADWTVTIGGLATPSTLTIAELRDRSEDQGLVLLECSGNGPTAKFGLMSAARWGGVLLADLLEGADAAAWGVEVVGFDDSSIPSENAHSTPGATWILPLDSLASSAAFLATTMNGEPLSADHGAPVRLVVPGWYGCSCIKWVTGLVLVGPDAPSTSQMLEFANRTEQLDEEGPPLARDYLLPEIDHAATVVRVERWRVDGRVRHRVIGLAWGGTEPAGTLSVVVGEGAWPADVQPVRDDLRTWALWEHALDPDMSGEVVLSTAIEGVRTRRLDRGYYDMAFEL
ncbi:MAG: molybdopterin-dependent oxidoreductase [Myxococcales bacterium]|nr:molybdopterin-dependent oxidoreductase [Myxococcales bacterium]MCB9690947.1 molybdopterin-dependent oxidoreductase [Alphaproteobacteria bacterium]